MEFKTNRNTNCLYYTILSSKGELYSWEFYKTLYRE